MELSELQTAIAVPKHTAAVDDVRAAIVAAPPKSQEEQAALVQKLQAIAAGIGPGVDYGHVIQAMGLRWEDFSIPNEARP
jgi:hypothetical protein